MFREADRNRAIKTLASVENVERTDESAWVWHRTHRDMLQGVTGQLTFLAENIGKLLGQANAMHTKQEGLELGQSVLKADLDAMATDKANRTKWFDNQLAEIRDNASADALHIRKLLELTNKRLKSLESPAKSAKKRSKKR